MIKQNVEFRTETKAIIVNIYDYIGHYDELSFEVLSKLGYTTKLNLLTYNNEVYEIDIISAWTDFTHENLKDFIDSGIETELAGIFLHWAKETNHKFNDIESFENAYEGAWESVEDFASNYIEECVSELPKFVADAISYELVWLNLENEFIIYYGEYEDKIHFARKIN